MNQVDPALSFNPDSEMVLTLAAMFEGNFSLDWLEELTGMKASAILLILENGVQRQLLARERPAIYHYKDDHTRQSRLKSFPAEDKDLYYRKIATILIRELPNDDSKVLKIANYLLKISNDQEGCRWLMKAGEIHVRSFRTEEAMTCFEKILSDLSEQTGEQEDQLFVDAMIEYSNITTVRHHTLSTLSLLKEARSRAERLEKISCVVLLDMHIAKYEWLRTNSYEAIQQFKQSLAKVPEINDQKLTDSVASFNTYFLFWQGRMKDVVEAYEKSVSNVEMYPIGHFPIVSAITVGRSYTMIGQLNQGLGMLDAIRNYCLEKKNYYLAAQAGSAIAMALLPINRIEDALKYFKQSLKEAEDSGNYWAKLSITFMTALAHYRKGNKKKSLEYLHRFLQHSREAYVSLALYPYLIEICWAMETGDLPAVSELSFEQEIERMLNVKNVFVRGIAYRYEAFWGKQKGWSSQKVVQSLSLSAKELKESGNQIELAKTYLELAHYYLSLNQEKKGRKNLEIASEILSSYDVKLIPDELKNLVGTRNPEKVILDEILDLGYEIEGNKDNRKSLNQIVATANRVIGAERGAILLKEKGLRDQKFILRASKNFTAEQLLQPSFEISRQIIQEVVSSAKGRIFHGGREKGIGTDTKDNIRSGICVPLVSNGRTMGVFYHDNRLLSNVFEESDLKLLNYFSNLAAVELHREQCVQELHRLHHKTTIKKHSHVAKDSQTHRFHGLVGKSLAFNEVLSQIGQVATTNSTVLIQGETGVGKNLVAKAIHNQSSRNEGPFVSVPCSALTESLITSELFGHEKGSFTGASYRKIGRFELADKGTLFLDEIGDLSMEVQSRLLRVLQSREFERVGGGRQTLTSDFRLVAATNRNLTLDVNGQKFREDLYYRINVFPVYIPPLRERREDIPLLANYFIDIYAKKCGKAIDRISDHEMEKLMRYNWPGNIRELENIIQRSIIVSQEPDFVLATPEPFPNKTYQTNDFYTLEENERRHIMEALRRSRWKIHGPGGAAAILDINPSTLSSRMKRLNIKKPSNNALDHLPGVASIP